jgi:CysZ protein
MPNLLTENPISNFSRGFFSPFHTVRFILDHKRLIKYILIPFSINLVVFSLAIYLGLDFFDYFISQHIPQGEAWYWFLLNYLLWIIAILLTAVLVFFSFAVVGSLIASPFNDILSEKTEGILTDKHNEEPFSFTIFLQDARRTLFDESKKILLFVLAMALLLLLNLVPGVGSLLYPILSAGLTIFFLIVEYTGYTFARKHLPFKEQRGYIFRNKSLLFGFGTGLLLVLAIPLFQFLCIPLGVVGGTRICFDSKSPMVVEKSRV